MISQNLPEMLIQNFLIFLEIVVYMVFSIPIFVYLFTYLCFIINGFFEIWFMILSGLQNLLKNKKIEHIIKFFTK